MLIINDFSLPSEELLGKLKDSNFYSDIYIYNERLNYALGLRYSDKDSVVQWRHSIRHYRGLNNRGVFLC